MNVYQLELCKGDEYNCVMDIELEGDEPLRTLERIIRGFVDVSPSDEFTLTNMCIAVDEVTPDTPIDEARGVYVACGDYFVMID